VATVVNTGAGEARVVMTGAGVARVVVTGAGMRASSRDEVEPRETEG